VLGEPDEVRQADLGIVVEPELGGLDRDLAADAGRLDAIEQLQVVGRDVVGLGQALEVLTEAGVQRDDALGLERPRARRPSSRPA
jgi:hypothetical protein